MQTQRLGRGSQIAALRRKGAALGALAGLLAVSVAQADSTTSSAGGTGGSAYTLGCPEGMVLVGIKGRSALFMDRVQGVCGRLDAASQTVGGTVTTGAAGGTGGTAYERLCPSGQAVVQLTGKAGGFLDRTFVHCAPVRSNGLRSGNPQIAWNAPIGTSPGGSLYGLLCANEGVASAMTGRASGLVDRIALVCSAAPVVATSLRDLTLSDSDALGGGTVSGTVALNGYTLNARQVALSVTGLAGLSVPPSVTIAANGSTAAFAVSSQASSAGCATVTASALGATRAAVVVYRPPALKSSDLSINIPNRRSNGTYFRGETIAGTITFDASAPSVRLAPAGGTITFTSSNASAIPAPSPIDVRRGTTSVSFSLSVAGTGCAVITAKLGTNSATTALLAAAFPE